MRKIKIIPIKMIQEKHDTDWDGVPNFKDCQPFNPHKQGILHPGKVQCARCYKWFSKDKIKYYKNKSFCKKCFVTEKHFDTEEQEHKEKLKEEDERIRKKYGDFSPEDLTERCPYCGSQNFKLIKEDYYDSTGDTFVCLKCHRNFLRYRFSDWEMKKMGYKF